VLEHTQSYHTPSSPALWRQKRSRKLWCRGGRLRPSARPFHTFLHLFTPFYTFLQYIFTPFLHLFTPLQTAPTCPQDAARHKAQAERAAAERAVQRAAAEREACRENIHRRPTLLASLECRVSELVNSDACPRPTTGGRRRTGRVAG
jgi:hypothetical protein